MNDRPEWGSISKLFCEAVVKAKIEDLEWAIAGQTGHWVDRISARIAELRKELLKGEAGS